MILITILCDAVIVALLAAWVFSPTLREIRLPHRDPLDRALRKLQRKARRRLSYFAIKQMELGLYGRSFDHIGAERFAHSTHDILAVDEHVWAPTHGKSREWRQFYELPKSDQGGSWGTGN